MALWEWKRRVAAEGRSGPGQFHHQLVAHNAEESIKFISKHMQAHFRADPVKGLGM
jgi:hypothetical protein